MEGSNILATTGPAVSTVIDIAATFKALYGYLPPSVPAMPASPNNVNPYSVFPYAVEKLTTAAGSNLYGLSDMIGREVFMPLTLKASSPMGGAAAYYNFPFTVISLKNKKILKETPMVERGGTVIEEVGLGAWEIDVKGFLIDANDNFPDDQLTQLFNLYKTGNFPAQSYTVEVQCALTDLALLGNTNVVITELDIPAKAKVIGVRDFSFKLVQDSILNLSVLNLQAVNIIGVGV